MLMKAIALCTMLAMGSAVVEQAQGDRTITKVVKLLQDMLAKSSKEGDEERVIYAKFKCYCDTSEADKTASIKELTEQISLLESHIAELQGSTGGLSSECADLKAKMADNKAAREEATSVRQKENKAFEAEEADLEQAIKQMKGAIKTLAAVGADQTKSTGADNSQFMAGHKAASSLLSLQANVQTALESAQSLMNEKQLSKTTAFLQAPFTGTYSSQSGQVMGIIKSMRDTFVANLADARTTEKNSEEAYEKFMDLKEAAHKEMSDSYDDKQKDLGGNDGSLASDKKSLASAEKKKASDEEFMEKLLPMCEDKAAGFANRKVLRANEEAAIAEAISILNSDEAFATFGGTDATTKGGLEFIQLRASRKHIVNYKSAQKMLQKVDQSVHSARISKVVALLQAENPFEEVLKEIDNMLEVISSEGEADEENFAFCKKERKDNHRDKKKKEREMNSLDASIDKLDKRINDPVKGLKALIQETEDSLLKNRASQATETKDRLEENIAYQKDIKNLVAAESILERATKALKTYYEDVMQKLDNGESLLQTKEDPDAPNADLNMKGQSSKGGDVIEMLEFIHSETVKEEDEAHKEEEEALADFDKSMTALKKQESDDEKLLAKTQDDLAQAEEDKLADEEDLKDTTADRDAIKAYLLKIKPGCDFITDNIKTRNANRKTESAALKKAIRLIKGTPAFKTFTATARVEGFGDCHSCDKDEENVECKACMADVTIPAYCAGHKGTKGC